MVVPTLEKVLLALLPRAVMAVMHTTMISANMTAYSTAVGPSSERTNRPSERAKRASMTSPSGPKKIGNETRGDQHRRPHGRATSWSAGSAHGEAERDQGRPRGGPLHSVTWRSLAAIAARTHGFASHPYGWFALVVDPHWALSVSANEQWRGHTQ